MSTSGRPGMTIEGASQLALTLRNAGSDLSDLKDTNSKVATYVTRQAQPATPQRTRTLASTGRAGSTKRAAIIRFGNNSSVRYARAVHGGRFFPTTGTRTPARPWASQTAQRTEPTWSDMYLIHVNKVLNTIRGV